jgi:hypothetical protein
MKSEEILTIAGIAAGTYILSRVLKKPTTQSETQESEATGTGGESAVFVRSGDATYRFAKGEYDKLNWAQKFLLSAHILPTSWILG